MRKKLEPLFEKEVYADCELGQLLKNINGIKNDEIERELAVINPESNRTALEIKRREIKAKMDSCKDEFDDILPNKQEEYDSLRKQLIAIKKEMDASEGSSTDDLKLNKIFNYSYLVANISIIQETIRTIKDIIIEIKSSLSNY